MKYRDRDGVSYDGDNGQDKFLKQLYGTVLGRMAVKLLCHPIVSKIGGHLLNARLSKLGIRPFIKNNHIDMSEYEPVSYCSYNDFFKRRIKPGKRPVNMADDVFISPCDAKLSVYRINKDRVFSIKNSEYTVSSLLRNKRLSDAFEGGYCFLFRLTVDDYHRFCYVDSGRKSRNFKIPGCLHTVNPAALDFADVYKENSREYTVIRTENFGDIVQMEVGAMMVGRIVNHDTKGYVCRGNEKGYFEFGGSTVIVLVKKNVVSVRMDILKNMKDGYETKVKLGEEVAYKLDKF